MDGKILPKCYYEYLFKFVVFGSLLIVPLVFLYKYFEEEPIKIEKPYYCYIQSCDTINPAYALTYSVYYEDYMDMYIFFNECIEFNLTEEKSTKLGSYLKELPLDSTIYVKEIIKDSTIAILKLRNNKYIHHPKREHYEFYEGMVPIFVLHEDPPPN